LIPHPAVALTLAQACGRAYLTGFTAAGVDSGRTDARFAADRAGDA